MFLTYDHLPFSVPATSHNVVKKTDKLEKVFIFPIVYLLDLFIFNYCTSYWRDQNIYRSLKKEKNLKFLTLLPVNFLNEIHKIFVTPIPIYALISNLCCIPMSSTSIDAKCAMSFSMSMTILWAFPLFGSLPLVN